MSSASLHAPSLSVDSVFNGGKRRSLSVLVVADAWIPVPPAGYGGSERVVDLMCRMLVAAGHSVRLVAAPGSRDFGNGLVAHRPPSGKYLSRVFRKLWFQWLLLRSLRGIDVVVNHGRLDYLELLYRTQIPVVHWFHNAFVGNEVSFIRSRRSHGDHFVGVSRYHVSTHPQADVFKVVENALDVDRSPFFDTVQGEGYVLFLGRLTQHKGAHVAIEACNRAGKRLILAGNKSNEPSERGYFEREIEPRISERCQWVGPYDEAKRHELLRGASVVMFPIQGSVETFGLVLVEALAAGVPVIATPLCSTPEIVIDGVNGFLCETTDAMVTALDRVSQFNRRRCRETVEERFGSAAFSSKVEKVLYEAVLEGSR